MSEMEEVFGADPFNKTELGKKYQPFEIEINPYMATGITLTTPKKKAYNGLLLNIKRQDTTNIKKSPSKRAMTMNGPIIKGNGDFITVGSGSERVFAE
jgi:hypothetical protein